MLYAVRTWELYSDEQFVQEQLYGVCDNQVYAYDVMGDAWNIIY